ncbi:4-fold beta flower protein [Hansschlegelia plantiphila]|uniref:4-fold beta flower domain-containing protein n=1 Tax=Hansschlegelia plantiphila TaxID=374655 RepID=A0A9W6MVN9_9HYPH|nr:hypothetical protein GCM10008179_17340 [Hansschlegelia plantiphila]
MDFYDRSGRASHYINNNGTLYRWDGTPLGFVRGQNVYSNRGIHVAVVSGGWIRDHKGAAVLYSPGNLTSGGPLPPVPKVPPLKRIPRIPPVPAVPRVPPIPAVPKLSWSGASFDSLFA